MLWKPRAKLWELASKTSDQRLARLRAFSQNGRAGGWVSSRAHLDSDLGRGGLFVWKIHQEAALTPCHQHQRHEAYYTNDESCFICFRIWLHGLYFLQSLVRRGLLVLLLRFACLCGHGCFVDWVRRMAVGLVDFRWATCHQFKRCFFWAEFTSLLTPNFMPATACFNMLLYPTVFSVLIIILAGTIHAPRQTARFVVTWIFKFIFCGAVCINVNASQTVVCPSREKHSMGQSRTRCRFFCTKPCHNGYSKDWMSDLRAKRSCSEYLRAGTKCVWLWNTRERYKKLLQSEEADLFCFQICHEKFHTLNCVAQKMAKLSCCGQYFMPGPQPVSGFDASGVPEFRFLKYFS